MFMEAFYFNYPQNNKKKKKPSSNVSITQVTNSHVSLDCLNNWKFY